LQAELDLDAPIRPRTLQGMAGNAPHIVVSQPHTLGVKGVRSKVEAVAATLGSKYNVTWTWVGGNAEFSSASGLARGVKGTIYVAPTQIQIAVFLPLMLLSFKNTIREGIVEALTEHLRPS
jgi:putative polyhydroxyalkanoate system protein